MTALKFPNESLRNKLVVAGIPETEHSVAALTARMQDLDAPQLQGLSADMRAELPPYLIVKGMVTFPKPSERALLDLPWGSHVCQFYDTKPDQLNMLVPYFKQGLERKRGLRVASGRFDGRRGEDCSGGRRARSRQVHGQWADADPALLAVLTDPNGTVKAPEQLSHEFAAMGSNAVATGFAGLRASGTVSWVKDDQSMSPFMNYESRVNLAIQNARIMVVCTYPTGAVSICGCRKLIHNHGKIFVKRGEWVHDKSKDAERIESVFAALEDAHAAGQTRLASAL